MRFAGRSEVLASSAMAATSHPLATQIALDVLKKGGSAVDAAIAANAALCLMEPTGSGIGGDLFALVWREQDRSLSGLNASGRSPAGLEFDWFADNGYERIPGIGPLCVSVPGAVDGWFELHEKYGRMPMADLLAPAIAYARNGFPVTGVIAATWQREAERLKDQPGFADVFLSCGDAPAVGDVFRNPALADTLECIARSGRCAFYEGEIASAIATHVQKHGGFLSLEDLGAHRSEWVDPVSAEYRGYTVWELPPNGQGIAALQMLNILGGFDVQAAGFGSPDYLHWLVEAKKLAYEDRARHYADPDFSDVPVAQLLSPGYADHQRGLIDPEKAALGIPVCDPRLDSGDTVYLTTADESGNMVSLIQSNYKGMGSGVAPAGLGFVLQDRGELFTLEPGHPNVYAPGKRPFHTIIPGFLTCKGERCMSFGVMGGAMQPQGHVQVLVNMIDFGMNTQEAGDAPRVYHSGSSSPTGQRMEDGGEVSLESGFDARTRQALSDRGHRLGDLKGVFGGYQAIRWLADKGVYAGASESRKDGCAAGY
jgi:gamma-glutamyltranspeptidase/glutathione hydrolase